MRLFHSCASSIVLCVFMSSAWAQQPTQTQSNIAAEIPDTDIQRLAEQSLNLRDPFQMGAQIVVVNEGTRSELETIPIEQLKLVGVMTGGHKLKAMVIGPNNKTYFIGEKTPIGIRRGYVKKIKPEALVVRERSLTVTGQEEEVDVEIKLPPESAFVAQQAGGGSK